jgi:hypothetical protein
MKRRLTQREKEEREAGRLLQAWPAWNREEREAVLAGPDGPMIERLLVICKGLPESRAILFAFVRGVPWRDIDEQTRCVALRAIDSAIIRFRDKAGLATFDDGLPGDRDNLFLAAKTLLFPVDDAAPTGAKPGLNSDNSRIEGKRKCLA